MKLTGGQIVAKALKANGVDFVAGMPGEGTWALVDTLLSAGTDIPFIQVIQEQSAVHLADGYFRACGRSMAVILPGALGHSKALGGIACALAGESAMLVISGEYSEGNDCRPAVPAWITKEHVRVASIDQLPQALRQSFDTMFSGRVGPVSLDIPAAVQSASIEVRLSPSTLRATSEVQRVDPQINVVALREDSASHSSEEGSGDVLPLKAQRPLAELRSVLEKDAILVAGAGSLQALVKEMFPVYESRSLCTASPPMSGWAVPAAIGVKLAMPARQVVCAVGDGDFLQSMQEMAVCVMHSIPVVFVVFNNSGYVSLSDVQTPLIEQHRAGEFNLPDGKPYSPDFAGIARNIGLEAWRVEHASQLNPTFIKALNSKGPSLVEVITARGSRVN
ncbi:thiamine pyrophosphate-dependent enzyme, probable carboxylase/decarboxylase/carboligase [Pseudomonas sp. GM21]|uniref:thiamine pyrophosphate-dependent enzyme n=1 Tax=Pseudomonas sp. GM21 TaxID=1144325 RepID=UPI00027228E0|nr:thiamine pyrophosphate-dependent enzyme [Pseudomonas sp. GM21]EJM22347.1 thiamine pyrophosphate-dependent enzyme, probable carboxylase/decarboxylase/carboligase [Pseudomonas sp. GM21]